MERVDFKTRSCLLCGRKLFVVVWKAREEVEICCDRFGGEAVAHNCACRVNQTLSPIGSRSR